MQEITLKFRRPEQRKIVLEKPGRRILWGVSSGEVAWASM